MDGLIKDIRYGLRSLLKRPAFTAVALITLALGIGANTAIFSVVDAVLFRPLPFREADRLVKVVESNPQRGRTRMMISLGDFAEWRNQNQSFEDMAVFAHVEFRVTGIAAPEEVSGNRVSANFFEFLGVTPTIGRTFLPEDEKPKGQLVAVLSHKYWVSRFGSDQNIAGKTITLNDKTYLIVGVLPPNFRETFESFPGRALIWEPAVPATEDGTRRGPGGYTAIARLKPGVTREEAGAEMAAIARRLAEAYPQTNQGVGANVYSLHEEVTKSSRQTLLILLAAVGFVLLIACANIAALLLARGLERAREVAIRLAIGAGRGRVIRQLLTESILLSLFGGALGWLLAVWLVKAIAPLIPSGMPRADEITLDRRALLFTLALSLLASLVFGLLPALQTAKVNLTEALKDSGRTASENRHSRWLRQALVVSQVTLTMILLIGAGLMTNSLIRLYRIDPGFNTQNLLVMSVSLPRADKEAPGKWNMFWDSLSERALSLPGAKGVAIVSPMPLGDSRYVMKVGLEGSGTAPREEELVGYHTVGGDYFRLLGIGLKRGRYFDANDNANSTPVVVVNESFAHSYLPGQEAVGRVLILNRGSKEDEQAATIVGVVDDSRARLDEKAQPNIYQLASQFPQPSMYLVTRTTTEPRGLFGAMRNVVFSLNPNQPVSQLTTMDEIWAEFTVGPRFYLTLLGSLAGLATALAAIGIYGVLSHTVSQWTREIGIRRALGAQDGHLLRLVIRQGMTLALVGGAAGVIGAAALTRLMRGWLYEVSTTDPVTFAVAILLLMLVALLACYVPARRATKIDPLVALRYE